MHERGDIFPVAALISRTLTASCGTPTRRSNAGGLADGGIEIVATGRSAVTLATWLQDLVERGKLREERR
jgi:hypothetical protein